MADSGTFVHEYLIVVRGDDGSAHLHCSSCRHQLCDVSENYRLAAKVIDEPIDKLGPLFGGMGHSIDARDVLPRLPLSLLRASSDAEVCPSSSEALWDMQLAEGGGAK